ncbi:MAG TPA: hypothetical protein VNQ90_07010 [Chthoniobacteraceae bacterium]|nr:hypothetical protein [Chthoniobacteraceae bacterium]
MKPIPSLLAALLFATLPSFPSRGDEIVWQESFETTPGKPYRGEEALEVLDDAGTPFLRVTLPGTQPLEGVRFPIPPLEGHRLLVVSAKVRGSGTLGPMIQAGNTWTRLPPVTLSDQWQAIEIPRTLGAGEQRPTLYFVSLPMDVVPDGMVFELSDLEARLAPPLALPQSKVPPRRFPMAGHSPERAVQEIDGKSVVSIRSSYASEELPFPQTREPIQLYLRYHAASTEDRVALCTRRGGAKQGLRELRPEREGWQWLTFANLSAEEAGEAITVEVWPSREASQTALLDAAILTSEVIPDETTLDTVP